MKIELMVLSLETLVEKLYINTFKILLCLMV
jgi:hypothetical protein